MKITVGIEEHLVKQVEIEIPDDTEECDVAETAMQKAIDMYYNEEIVLTSDDFSGVRLVAVTEDGYETEWEEF